MEQIHLNHPINLPNMYSLRLRVQSYFTSTYHIGFIGIGSFTWKLDPRVGLLYCTYERYEYMLIFYGVLQYKVDYLVDPLA